MATKTWTVIYRTGGWANAEWHKTTPVRTYQEARERQYEIWKGGRKALIHMTDALDAIGMPIGYCFACHPVTGECTQNRHCDRKSEN